MLQKLHYKWFVLLVILPTLVIAKADWNGKHTKVKTIKKAFNVNKNALLKVNNSYGNISVATYNGQTVTIEVTIKTNGNDLEKVEKKLDDITVNFSAHPSLVEAKTIIGRSKTSSWWNWGRNNNVNMEINYRINLPITNQVDLNNDYGNISLDKLEGRAVISCDYGKITTKELMANDNELNFDYTSNSYFEYIKSGTINADYSGFTVAKANILIINADYTKSVIEIVEDLTYHCDYGSITINKANNVTGNGDYLTTRLGNIYKNVSIKADYGSIKIDKMMPQSGSVAINSEYVGITVGYDPAYHFNFEVDLEYASFKGDEAFEITTKKIESFKKYYKGYHGTPNFGNNIKINSEFGSITFKKN